MLPVAQDVWKVQFCAGRELRDAILEAQDLMRHRVPDGDLQLLRLPDLFRITHRAERRPGVRGGVHEVAVLARGPRDAIAQLGGARRFR